MKILIVDDEPHVAKIAAMALRKVSQFEVESAETGEEGIRAARDGRPDVILLDVQLPDISGLEVLSRLRADPETAAIPVVLCTASVERADEDLASGAGAQGVIKKPFDPLTLGADILRLIKRT